MASRTLILSAKQIEQKVQRIAHQICETHFKEQEVIVVGVTEKGYQLAQRIHHILKEIAPFKTRLFPITIDKHYPLDSDTQFEATMEEIQNKCIVLADDVLNTGRTLIYVVSFILQVKVKRLSTVVLVDRRHRLFPVRADFVGLTLSTTLQEHIAVELSDTPSHNDVVYLV